MDIPGPKNTLSVHLDTVSAAGFAGVAKIFEIAASGGILTSGVTGPNVYFPSKLDTIRGGDKMEPTCPDFSRICWKPTT
jgi:hypothetical protein